MERSTVKSLSIRSVGYDPIKKELEIELSSGVFRFFNIPQSIYDSFIESQSKGLFFTANIKSKFPYQRMQ